jgi:hypothetical protein
VEQLADRFVAAQRSIEHVEAREIAEQIVADDELLKVARHWLTTGGWPDEPTYQGFMPSGLASHYRPTLVFAALMLLKTEPERALQYILHGRPDPEMPAASKQVASLSDLSDEELEMLREVAQAMEARSRRKPPAASGG